jgi:hypothetical protein
VVFLESTYKLTLAPDAMPLAAPTAKPRRYKSVRLGQGNMGAKNEAGENNVFPRKWPPRRIRRVIGLILIARVRSESATSTLGVG